MTDLQGKDFVALRRLSDADDHTIAAVGETCERVPAAKSGGTASDALARLLASGKIAAVGQAASVPVAAAPVGVPDVPAVPVDEPEPADDGVDQAAATSAEKGPFA